MPPITASLGTIIVGDSASTAIMGVINRDPNSFFRGSYFRTQRRALKEVEKMQEEGADIIDVGGASTAPDAVHVSVEQEEKRVIPLVREITRRWDISVSVDTQQSTIASRAIRYGATIVNDVSGLKADSNMARVIKDTGSSCVVMACQQSPGDCHTMELIKRALKHSLAIASSAGIPDSKIAIDPGIGFGKPAQCDLGIIRHLRALRELERPILVGVSRKHFIGHILGYPSPNQRLAGTLAAVSVAVSEGAHIIRAHDVRGSRDCIKIVEAIHNAQECQ